MNAEARGRVAVVQISSGDDVSANLAASRRGLEAAARAGARLAALPENFAFMGAHESDKLAHAETPGAGPIQDFLARSARELGLWIVGGTLPMQAPGEARVHAASLVFDDSGRCVARYDKIHLFDVELPESIAPDEGALLHREHHPGLAGALTPAPLPAGEGKAKAGPLGERYRESASIAPGACNPVVVDTPCGRLGLSVCYDLRFPELYRALLTQGAQLLSVPAAFTERTGRAHWEFLLRARAVENLCLVLAPGQCGTHPGGRRTWGHSAIVQPWGEWQACGETPDTLVAEFDLQAQQQLRARFPVIDHRRLI